MPKTLSATAESGEESWPIWVPVGSAIVLGVSVIVSVLQRFAFGYPKLLPLIAAAITLLPFLLDIAGYLFDKRLALPLWLFPVPVLIGTALFVFRPPPTDFAPFLLVFMTAEIVSRSERKVFLPIVVGIASVAVIVAAEVFGPYKGSFVWAIGIGFGWFGGFMVKTLDRKQSELHKAQAGLAQKAAADERSRIAREVHDVIAHSMSVTMLHVTAARMALEKGADNAKDALEALREAEQQGRRSLDEIRRTVGLLGSEDNVAAPPQPDASDIPTLVSEFNAAGLDVSLEMSGDVAHLPPGAGLSLYRIVQESLTNVVKHAPGARASVQLEVTDTDLKLHVHNPSINGTVVAEAGGLGLRGMRERALVLAGTLIAGHDGDGWTVALDAPRPITDAS